MFRSCIGGGIPVRLGKPGGTERSEARVGCRRAAGPDLTAIPSSGESGFVLL